MATIGNFYKGNKVKYDNNKKVKRFKKGEISTLTKATLKFSGFHLLVGKGLLIISLRKSLERENTSLKRVVISGFSFGMNWISYFTLAFRPVSRSTASGRCHFLFPWVF